MNDMSRADSGVVLAAPPDADARLRFETFLSDLAARFLSTPTHEIETTLAESLEDLVAVLDVDRCGLAQFEGGGQSLTTVHAYGRPGTPPQDTSDLAAALPWYARQLREGRVVHLSRLPGDLPPGAAAEIEYVTRQGLKSHLALPLVVGDEVLGGLGVSSFRAHRSWEPAFVARLSRLAGVHANALHRLRNERRLREAEGRARAVLESVSSDVVVLDREGRILDGNQTWRRSLRYAGVPADRAAVGEDYLPVILERAGEPRGPELVQGLSRVLGGADEHFEGTYTCRGEDGLRHLLLTANPLLGNGGGAVVVHTDVTELARAKAELERSLQEIHDLKERLEAENTVLQQEVQRGLGFEEIVGTSAPLAKVLAQVEQVAVTDVPVLLLGETGTGKDLVARALHARSRRRSRALLAVNCAALPAALIESELFGYEKGAFTGALQRTPGRFEVADGGTLLLDEVGEIPLDVQAKLLRVLQSGEFERLGSARTLKVNVRVIAATNRDLERDVKEGHFRADLFYRLSVFPITLPPLRTRAEDVPLLVWHYIERRQGQLGRTIRRVPERLMRALTAYPWPGNVRELENVIERALILSDGPTLAVESGFLEAAGEPAPPPAGLSLEAAERQHIRSVLEACDWKLAGKGNAAEKLGLKRSTLQFRMKKLGITRPGAPRPGRAALPGPTE